jgi:hypothetical protein
VDDFITPIEEIVEDDLEYIKASIIELYGQCENLEDDADIE